MGPWSVCSFPLSRLWPPLVLFVACSSPTRGLLFSRPSSFWSYSHLSWFSSWSWKLVCVPVTLSLGAPQCSCSLLSVLFLLSLPLLSLCSVQVIRSRFFLASMLLSSFFVWSLSSGFRFVWYVSSVSSGVSALLSCALLALVVGFGLYLSCGRRALCVVLVSPYFHPLSPSFSPLPSLSLFPLSSLLSLSPLFPPRKKEKNNLPSSPSFSLAALSSPSLSFRSHTNDLLSSNSLGFFSPPLLFVSRIIFLACTTAERERGRKPSHAPSY